MLWLAERSWGFLLVLVPYLAWVVFRMKNRKNAPEVNLQKTVDSTAWRASIYLIIWSLYYGVLMMVMNVLAEDITVLREVLPPLQFLFGKMAILLVLALIADVAYCLYKLWSSTVKNQPETT